VVLHNSAEGDWLVKLTFWAEGIGQGVFIWLAEWELGVVPVLTMVIPWLMES